MKTKRTNRLLALLLSLVMVVGLLPMSVLAAGEDTTAPVRYEYVLTGDDPLESGYYALRASGNTLYCGQSSANIDQCGTAVTVSNGLLTLDGHGDSHIWHIVKTDDGYTIQSMGGGGLYLNYGVAGNISNLPVSTTSATFNITYGTVDNKGNPRTDDCYAVSWTTEDENTLYINRSDNKWYAYTGGWGIGFEFYKKTPVWRVTFTGEGVSESTAEVRDGGNATLPAEPSRDGYTFQGWLVDGEAFTAETAVTANVTATAQWEAISVEPETPETEPRLYFGSPSATDMVWQVSNGTGLNNALTTPSGANVTEITDGLEFRIWTSGGFLKFDPDGNTLLAAKKAGGQYAEPIHAVEPFNGAYLIYRENSGTKYYLTAENKNGQAVLSPNKADAVPYFFEAITEGGNNFRIYCEGPYTVSFTGEGVTETSIQAMYGQKPALPTPTREGFTFQGWYVGEDAFTAVTGDMTLTAKWEEVTEEPDPVETGKLPAPAEVEAAIEYRLAEGTLTEGTYIIVGSTTEANNTPRSMHYWTDNRTALDQCASGAAAGAETVSFNDIATNHRWNVTRTAEGKYTFAAVAAQGNYLTGGAGTLSRGTTATEFTVVARSDGGHDLSWVDGGTTYTMAWDGTRASGSRWYGAADGQYRINLYKEGFVVAQTKFSGTSDKPMDRLHILNDADDVDTEYRIPALATLDNGWIVAACDIRWTSTQDSPNNLDTIVSVSKDGGQTWEWEIVNYFSDFAPINGGSQRVYSASFIDPALLVDNDGTLWMAVDLQPAHVNLGNNAQKTGSGFDEDGLLMVGPISETEWETKVNTELGRTEATRLQYQAQYEYRVDINSVDDAPDTTTTKNGKTVDLYPIFHKDTKANTGYYVDAFFDLYYDYDEGGVQPVLVAQKESSALIQANLFYVQSPWKAYSTTYLMIRKATVNEETETLDWGDPQLISGVKNFDGETFLAFCPGRGTQTESGRIIFPVYDNVSGERASSVYTDDGGLTWHRGERIENGETSSNSESQVVVLHDAQGTSFLRMFSRNPSENQYVSYADSFDNGVNWTTTKYDRDMPNGHGTMMSFINLKGFLVSPEGAVYGDVVLASYPRGGTLGRRSNGIVRIGYYDAEDETMVWLNDKEAIRYPYKFTYSCLTQLRDGDGFTDRFALLYEDERTWSANFGMEMGFDTFTSADLLGEGWVLVQGRPALPTIESTIVRDEDTAPIVVAANVLDLDKDATGALSAAVTIGDEGENDEDEEVKVIWTSSDESVATVSKAAEQANLLSAEVATASDEQVVITAVGVGKAFITATTTKNGVTRKSVTEVVVQDGAAEITLPQSFEDEMTTVEVPETKTVYELDKDGLEDGVYIIYSPNGNRVIHGGGNATNHCTPVWDGSEAMFANHSGDNWDPQDDLWQVTKQADGSYAITALHGGNYLTPNASGTQLALNGTAASFTIEHQGDGSYYVKSGDNYLAFSGGWKMQSGASIIKFYRQANYVAGTTYTVSTKGLEEMIRACDEDMDAYAEVLEDMELTYTNDAAAAAAAQARIDEVAKALYARKTGRAEDIYTIAAIPAQTYTGEAVTPTVTLRKNGLNVTDGNYAVTYENNVEAGTATVTVRIAGEEVATATFEIKEVIVELDEYTILSVIYDQVYTGSPITPAVTVLKNGAVTEEYELEYLNNTAVGTATVNVLVDGEIVASVEFEIVGEVEQEDVYTVGAIAGRVYSGEAIEPAVRVYKNGALMSGGYTVAYENNVNVGTATVVVLVDGAEVARATFQIIEAASSGTGTGGTPAQPAAPAQPSEPVEDLEDPDVPLAELPMNFVDVAEDDWFYDEVQYVHDEGLMGGVTSTEFAPNSNTTRAQIVTILYRLENKPEVEAATFADVAEDAWYADSVAWGQMSGVVTGVGGGNFSPNRDVTRQELMVILYRYAKYKALDVTAAGDLSVFQDGATTSDWAVESMIWAVGAGLIRGKGGDRLDPAGTATRAEVATILMRFCEDFLK